LHQLWVVIILFAEAIILIAEVLFLSVDWIILNTVDINLNAERINLIAEAIILFAKLTILSAFGIFLLAVRIFLKVGDTFLFWDLLIFCVLKFYSFYLCKLWTCGYDRDARTSLGNISNVLFVYHSSKSGDFEYHTVLNWNTLPSGVIIHLTVNNLYKAWVIIHLNRE
jgi:hypothetical protein